MKIERDERRFDFHDIGLAIKRAREASGMTQEQLAYIVDRAPRTIMYNENDGQHPSLNTFYQMVTMFDISVGEVRGRQGGAHHTRDHQRRTGRRGHSPFPKLSHVFCRTPFLNVLLLSINNGRPSFILIHAGRAQAHQMSPAVEELHDLHPYSVGVPHVFLCDHMVGGAIAHRAPPLEQGHLRLTQESLVGEWVVMITP